MRVLHMIETLGRGGAEHLLVTLLPALKARGVGVSVAVLRGPLDLKPDLEAAGVPVHVLPNRHRWSLPLVAWDVARLARAEGADIVHAHLYFPSVSVGLMRRLGMSRARTVVSFHNLAYAGANTANRKLALRRGLARWAYGGADLRLGVSQAVADHYAATFGRAVSVLHNPVDLSRLDQGAGLGAVPGAATGGDCRIVLPGRVVKEKGHADFIKALALLRERGLEPSVDIAGDGPLRGLIQQQVAEAGLTRVTFHGALPHDALMQIVGRADIVAVPSRHEGFGLTALEAMALGRAVVASDAGGLPEVVGKAGITVPAGDTHALADGLGDLCADPERRAELGRAAQARAIQFDAPSVAADLAERYADLTRRQP